MNNKIIKILDALDKAMPDAKVELDFTTPLELLVATILSAQCTDKRVNLVTPALFDRYKNAKAFAEAEQTELEELVSSINFFRNKARAITRLRHPCLRGRYSRKARCDKAWPDHQDQPG